MDDSEATNLLQVQTVAVKDQTHHSSHHHHHHHHHEDGNDTIAHTMISGLETDTTLQNPQQLSKDDERDKSDSSGPVGNFIFSDSVKRARIKESKIIRTDDAAYINQFCSRYQQPSTTNTPSFTKGHMPGHVPLTSLFHMESNRENKGPEDDGLEDADLTAADGIVRVKKDRNQKKQFIPSDNMRIIKGEFTFPHRTYKPKCQIAYRVPAGQVPQAVMAERLHRIYKKTDINLILQTLGIELSDLIPPSNYGENNERFYHEMMFRNRTKINGIEKKDILAHGGRFTQFFAPESEEEEEGDHSIHKAEVDSTLSTTTPSDEKTDKAPSNADATDKNDEEDDGEGERKKSSIHPFIQSKPPFLPQFPLGYFDNSEFDIRSGDDWCRLGWDEKEKRFYPLPAKAFLPLPLPLERRSRSKAPSELTVEEILRKTPRLEKFRAWLLRERYQRQIRLVGLDPTKITKLTPSDAEMNLVARLGSTVETMASLSDDSLQEFQAAVKRLSKRLSKMGADVDADATVATVTSGEQEQGEEAGENSNSDPDMNSKATAVKDEDQLNIVYKLRQLKKDDDLSDDDDKGLITNEDAKRSVSILSDVFSDLDSLTMLGTDIITTIQRVPGAETEATDAEEIDEDSDRFLGDKGPRGLNRPVRSYFLGDYGLNIPSSPDIDPLEDGLDQYVIDFDKMKKVHIYDWRWVDVAVFDYHPTQDKYFVRSIHPPVVYAWVNKLYLCFDAEDPNKHGMRIKDAVKRRFEMENIMRYNLYVDCLPMIDMPNLEDFVLDRITQRVIRTSNLKRTEHALQKVQREINLDYQRTIADEKFQKLAEKHQKTFKPWVQVPDKNETPMITNIDHVPKAVRAPHDFLPAVHLQNFEYKVKTIQKNTVIYTDEAWKPYREIMNICLKAKEMAIIITKDLLPMHLDDWEKMQEENIEEIKRVLEEEWYESVVANLKANFDKLSKSWYNLTENNYDVFEMSKLSNFLQLVKIMMQDTIRSIVKDSCTSFMEQIKAYSENIDPSTDWSWGEDLIHSEYPPPKGLIPLWTLEMYMDPTEGPKYMQPLSSFYRNAYTTFCHAIQSCSSMPTLLLKVMPQMQFAALGFLNGVSESEVEMIELAHNLIKYTKLILLPLEAYIRRFNRYKQVWTLDIPAYIKTLDETDLTANDVKKLVEQNVRHMERLEKEIPSDIKITAFRIVVEHVREGILKKKKHLINSILDSYAFKLRKIIQKVQKDYSEMEKRLTLRSDDIEEVMELKGYVEIIPSLVARLDNVTNAVIKDYEVFDHFLYQVTNEDVNAKWQAAISSNRFLRLGREATKWLDEDYERLLKVQQADLSTLSDQVDSATLTVAGLVAYTELEKAQDVCQEIKKIWKTIKDLQEQSALLNRRQKIFALPLAQNEALNRLTRDIEPFKNLWFTASDWVTVQESLFAGTLDKVDIDQVTRVIHDGGKVMGRCIKYFAGADQIQHIAKSIKHQLEEFKPLVPLIKTLKKPEMRQRHWQAITDVCGFTLVERANQNFKKLLEHGIKEHVHDITEIGDLATKEYDVEFALNKMILGIDRHQVLQAFNEDYKIPIVIISPHTMETIDEYITMTNDILANPFNVPFQEKLGIWDRKIKLSKVNLELWIDNQEKWLQIQPTFMSPDAATKLPVTFKLYERMQRIWRRLIRLARDTREILELASDNTTMASLQQFASLLANIQKSLEEYTRPKGSDESDDD